MRDQHTYSTCIDLATIKTLASRQLSATPRPFLKWAGAKRKLLSSLVPFVPVKFNTYFEPFVGGASMFFLLRPNEARLGDICADLVNAYEAIRDNVQLVVSYLREWKPSKASYYRMRKHRSNGKYKRAAQLIYLNKLCWNGLYRVNLSGEFNVPYGRPRSDRILHEDNLQACSTALQSARCQIRLGDFEQTVADAIEGDFVYFDPPYVTTHNDNGFVEYNERIFSWSDQVRLAELARHLKSKGVHVLVSNADHPPVVRLYRDFATAVIMRSSTLSGDRRFRGRVAERVFYG